jgi:hypothetical protein
MSEPKVCKRCSDPRCTVKFYTLTAGNMYTAQHLRALELCNQNRIAAALNSIDALLREVVKVGRLG